MTDKDREWQEHLIEFKVFQSRIQEHIRLGTENQKLLFEELKIINADIKALHAQVSLARHFLLFMKLSGYTILFALAFKFGDIKSLWSAFFNGT